MRLTHRLFLLSMAVALGTMLCAVPARADDLADEADLQFQLGAERYEVKDFKGALEHFLSSNRLVPNKNVLFNIARTYEQLGRSPDAYRYYVLALEGETSPQLKRRVEDALQRISPAVAILKVETDPPGATVYLDRRDLGPRGTTPRTLGLPDGRRRVIVEKQGYEPAESEPLVLKAGAEQTVTLRLKQILGTARLEGEPGAVVRVDDDTTPVVCTVPCSAPVPPGRHTFFFSKEGFQTGEVTTDIPANQITMVRGRLSSQTGAVVVSADIRDALVTVDGHAVGFTPTVLNVPVGKHTVVVSQQGYRSVSQVVDVSRKETKIEAQLAFVEEVSAASRVTESVEDAPASVSIISIQELRAMGYPTLGEALRGIRGIYLSDDRSYTTAGFRGFSRPGDYGNRVLVLLDGQPMNDNYIWSSYVGTDARVDIDDIERIEVVRGPGSVLYGSSAFFGVINLVTRSHNQPTHGEASLGTFEYGITKARATANVRFSPDAGFWATVSGQQGAGRDFFFPEYQSDPRDPNAPLGANGRPTDGNARDADRQHGGMVTGRLWYKAFTLQWFLNSRKKYLPTGEYDTIFGDRSARFADTRGMVEGRFEPQLTQSIQSLTRAHVNMYDFDGTSPYAPASGGTSHDSYRGRWGGLEQRFVFTPSNALRLTVGGELIRHFQTHQVGESEAGAYLLDDAGGAGRNDPFTVGAGYVNADVTATPRLKLVAGARLDYYSNLPEFDVAAALNPRLAVIFKPYDGGNIKVMGAKAFRAPSVYELHYTALFQLPPASLKPEQIYSAEIEYSHRFSQTVTGLVAGYTNLVQDLVRLNETAPNSGIVQYSNSPAEVLVLGAEAEVRREWRQGWMMSATYSYSKARYINDVTLRDVPNSIEHLASFKGAVPIIGRTIMAMTRVSIEGPRPDRNELVTDAPQRTTDPAVIWDLVLSGEIERMSTRYAIGAYNLGDFKYSVVPSGEFRQRTLVQNGRTVLATITTSF
ncbi:MAG: TonB-dependent receptor [Labilithrix sp.]|nr:TonB-dependent receptor [Labilithrix sp.]